MKKTTTLKKNYEFRNVLTRGKKYSGKYIDIYWIKNNLNENKLGIAVSSKVLNSVNRNRVKRLIRENYRLIEEKIKIGNSLVIMWKKNRRIEEAKFFNINQDINIFIEKFEIIKNNR